MKHNLHNAPRKALRHSLTAALLGAGALAAPAFAEGYDPIDINQADTAELIRLHGVGPTLAAAIVEHRELFGPFESIEALTQVSGIGPATLQRNEGQLLINAE
ncbi:hypothetical protein CKO15_04240 [Halorhodospira abdelmalekii]|uniref:ComEA family DNA-binding protein n=1 Tax=Halorhodospira abdelmalekii TaxID=421629 RepID=UPI0019077B0B|nr:helix-hairpin-helix domain-containing protein [Halorhodospira abdelmalekii]MBK1734507.1 hypothetical protein [Halorhodospira abdelmalekii]